VYHSAVLNGSNRGDLLFKAVDFTQDPYLCGANSTQAACNNQTYNGQCYWLGNTANYYNLVPNTCKTNWEIGGIVLKDINQRKTHSGIVTNPATSTIRENSRNISSSYIESSNYPDLLGNQYGSCFCTSQPIPGDFYLNPSWLRYGDQSLSAAYNGGATNSIFPDGLHTRAFGDNYIDGSHVTTMKSNLNSWASNVASALETMGPYDPPYSYGQRYAFYAYTDVDGVYSSYGFPGSMCSGALLEASKLAKANGWTGTALWNVSYPASGTGGRLQLAAQAAVDVSWFIYDQLAYGAMHGFFLSKQSGSGFCSGGCSAGWVNDDGTHSVATGLAYQAVNCIGSNQCGNQYQGGLIDGQNTGSFAFPSRIPDGSSISPDDIASEVANNGGLSTWSTIETEVSYSPASTTCDTAYRCAFDCSVCAYGCNSTHTACKAACTNNTPPAFCNHCGPGLVCDHDPMTCASQCL
jgi:hypothetical protein